MKENETALLLDKDALLTRLIELQDFLAVAPSDQDSDEFGRWHDAIEQILNTWDERPNIDLTELAQRIEIAITDEEVIALCRAWNRRRK